MHPDIAAARPRRGVPGDLIDLTRWYLTLPIKDPTGRDRSGPWDVHQPDLRCFSCEYFRIPSVGSVPAVEYTAPVDGVHHVRVGPHPVRAAGDERRHR